MHVKVVSWPLYLPIPIVFTLVYNSAIILPPKLFVLTLSQLFTVFSKTKSQWPRISPFHNHTMWAVQCFCCWICPLSVFLTVAVKVVQLAYQGHATLPVLTHFRPEGSLEIHPDQVVQTHSSTFSYLWLVESIAAQWVINCSIKGGKLVWHSKCLWSYHVELWCCAPWSFCNFQKPYQLHINNILCYGWKWPCRKYFTVADWGLRAQSEELFLKQGWRT